MVIDMVLLHLIIQLLVILVMVEVEASLRVTAT